MHDLSHVVGFDRRVTSANVDVEVVKLMMWEWHPYLCLAIARYPVTILCKARFQPRGPCR